ncbi:unnamed protein product, partial [Phaeothamnion confervicola]
DAEVREAREDLAARGMLPNAVLVVGATGETGQWVCLKLIEKGFNVRLFVRNLRKAEELWGPDGSCGDIVVGDVRDAAAFAEAAAGCQAVVYCAGSRNIFGGNSFQQVDFEGVVNCVEAARESGTVLKIVLLSSIGASRPAAAPGGA